MRAPWRFLALNAAVWLAMTAILVVVPDTLERWMPLTVARPLGWVFAFAVWAAVIEGQWRQRFSAVPRFLWQVLLWVTAVIAATWVSDQFRV